jgi:hypothetical protein
MSKVFELEIFTFKVSSMYCVSCSILKAMQNYESLEAEPGRTHNALSLVLMASVLDKKTMINTTCAWPYVNSIY